MTWAYRTHRLCLQELPSGAIISVRGSGAYPEDSNLFTWLALGNTIVVDFLVKVAMGRGGHPQFDQGDLKEIPFPQIPLDVAAELTQCGNSALMLRKSIASIPELSLSSSRIFGCLAEGANVSTRVEAARTALVRQMKQFDGIERRANEIAFQLYGIQAEDKMAIEQSNCPIELDSDGEASESEDCPIEPDDVTLTSVQIVQEIVSWALGCNLGRWDVCNFNGEKTSGDISDPFDPLPVCSPWMLQGVDRLPLEVAPTGYPLRINWDGILVDDLDHNDDISQRLREVVEIIWKDRAEAIEHEACEILGVKELRDYFRKSGKGGFWDDHVSRYSKSRRKAPIYWLLQSSKKNYALWLYYHRLDKDLLFKAMVNYVEPKIRLESSRLETLRSQKAAAGESGKEAKRLAKEIEKQEDFLSELRDFEDKLRRAANLHLEPDLNDGVVLNIAPLHELVPWKVAKEYWNELLEGKYEWSSIGKQLREKGLVRE